jgi:hypothetical protein
LTARSMTLLAAAFVAVVLATGCGGGGGDSTSTGASGSAGATAGGGSESGSNSSAESGSGGESSGAGGLSESSLSKEEYVKQASAACNKEREGLIEEVAAYLEKHGSDNLPEGVLIANMAKQVVLPVVEAEVETVRSFGAPAGDEQKVEALLASQEAAVEEVKGLKTAKSLEEVEAHFDSATKEFRAYGFTACTNSI